MRTGISITITPSARRRLEAISSGEPNPSSLLFSNNKFICRLGTAAGNLRDVIDFLQNDCDFALGMCWFGCTYQQPLQLDECGQIDARRAQGHRGANHGIEHPTGDGNHDTHRPLHLQELTCRSMLYAADADLTPEIGMPTIMDFQLLPRHGQNERVIALGRKSWLFCGSDRGGQQASVMYSLIVTAKMNDVDPQAWLADVLARIAEHPAQKLGELLPWNWPQLKQPVSRAA